MAPITWQNVNGPSLDGAYRPLLAASHMFGSATDGLMKILDDRNATNKSNYEQSKVNNLNTIAQAALGITSPEDKTGFDGLRKKVTDYGSEIDAIKALNLIDNRESNLVSNFLNTSKYENEVREKKDFPLSTAFNAALYSGKFDEAQKLLPHIQNSKDESEALYRVMADTEARKRQARLDAQNAANSAVSRQVSLAQLENAKNSKLAGQLASATAQDFANRLAIYDSKVAAYMKSKGLTPEKLKTKGSTDLQLIQAEIEEFAGKAPSTSDTLTNAQKLLLQAGVPVDQAQAQLNTLSGILTTGRQITKADDEKLKNEITRINKEFDGIRQNNPYYLEDNDKNLANRKLIADSIRKEIQDNEWTKENVTKGVMDILDKGIKIQGADGKERDMPVSPAIALKLLSESLEVNAKPWTRNLTDANLKEKLENHYKDQKNLGAIKEGTDVKLRQAARLAELNKLPMSNADLMNNFNTYIEAAKFREQNPKK
jgi:hypothetical protein